MKMTRQDLEVEASSNVGVMSSIGDIELANGRARELAPTVSPLEAILNILSIYPTLYFNQSLHFFPFSYYISSCNLHFL